MVVEIKKILWFITFILLINLVYAQEICPELGNNTVEIVVFHGQGCPHCAKLNEFLEEIKPDYSNLVIKEYEIYFNDENRELFQQMTEAYNTEIQGVPTVFIDKKVIVGFNDDIKKDIQQEIDRCSLEECISPESKLLEENGVTQVKGDSSPTESEEKIDTKKRLTLGVVIGAAAVDAINPCAFAVLIILLTTILIAGSKKRALLAGLAFTLSIFISYYLMGLGLYSAIKAAGITHIFFTIVAILAILVGLFNLKDYMFYGKWFIMEVPKKWRPLMKKLLRGITSIPGAFLIGFVISLFLLPCTSGPYIVILGLLAKVSTRNSALWLLLLYNLIFILPMLTITLAIYFGFTTTEKAEEWRTKRLKTLHLIAGILLILIGIGMFIAMYFGVV